MSEPIATETKKREPFVYQAAKAGVCAPIIAIVLGIASQGVMKESPTAAMIIGGVNTIFLLVGFVMASTALIGCVKYGKARLLVRGIAGLGLNGLFLAAAVYLLFLFIPGHFDQKLLGTWEWRDVGRGLSQRMEFHADSHFRVVSMGLNASESSEVNGTWQTATKRGDENLDFYLVLQPESVSGSASYELIGKKLGYKIIQMRDDHVTLDYVGEARTYLRIANH